MRDENYQEKSLPKYSSRFAGNCLAPTLRVIRADRGKYIPIEVGKPKITEDCLAPTLRGITATRRQQNNDK